MYDRNYLGKGLLVIGLVLSLACAAGASAANFLANPGFDTDLSDWLGTASSVWDGLDEYGVPGSGSVLVTTPHFEGGNNVLIYQCLSVTPGETLLLGVSTYLASGQTETGYGWIWGGFIASPGCSGETIGQVSKVNGSPLMDVWERLETTYVVPPSAQSVRLNVYCANPSSSPFAFAFQCHFDNVYLPEPSRWLLAFSAFGTLAALRRAT